MGREDEPVFDCERCDLNVHDVVAAQARRLGELACDLCMARTGGDKPNGRLLEIGGRDGPGVGQRDRMPPNTLGLVIRRRNA